MTTEQDITASLAEYERRAIESGHWDGYDPVMFSSDGETWAEHITPTAEDRYPALARAVVYRKDVSRPTVVTMSWVEALPEDEGGIILWQRKPHILFGAAVLRTAIHRAYRDVIPERSRTAPEPAPTPEPAAEAPVEPARDWLAEIEAVADVDALTTLHGEMKSLRVVTPKLEVRMRARRKELLQPAPEPAGSSKPRRTPARKGGKPRAKSPKPQPQQPTAVSLAVMDALAAKGEGK